MADRHRQQCSRADSTRRVRPCFGCSVATRASSAREDETTKSSKSNISNTPHTGGGSRRCKTAPPSRIPVPKKSTKATVDQIEVERKRKATPCKKMESPKRRCVGGKTIKSGSKSATGSNPATYHLRSGRNAPRPRSGRVALTARLNSARPCRKARSQDNKVSENDESFPFIDGQVVSEASNPSGSDQTLSKELEEKCTLEKESRATDNQHQGETHQKEQSKGKDQLNTNNEQSPTSKAGSLSESSSELRPCPVVQTKERCTRIASNPIPVSHLMYVMKDNQKLLLGSGKYGTVFLCQHAPSGKYVAFKKYDSKTSTEQKHNHPRAYMSDILTEAVCIQIASDACRGYPHLHGIVQNKNGEWLGLVLEFIGRSLNSRRGMTFRNALTEGVLRCNEVWDILKQITSHLLALHTIGMVHNDFHFGNVLLQRRQKDGERTFRAYVIDLGLCTKMGQRSIIDPAADLPKIAPELKRSDGVHSAKSDIFAFGYYLIRLAENNESMAPLKILGKACWTNDIDSRPSSMKDVLLELNRLHELSSKDKKH